MPEERRALFVGNIGHGRDQAEVEDQFSRFGPIHRIEMKRGFCFLYFEVDADGDAAIAEMHGTTCFGRLVTVEWARGDGAKRQKETVRRIVPSKNLFVVNFDPDRTREHDLRLFFSEFGPIQEVMMKQNWAIVEYMAQEDAVLAQHKLDNSRFQGRQITVNFAVSSAAKRPRDSGHRFEDRTRRQRDLSPPDYRERYDAPRIHYEAPAPRDYSGYPDSRYWTPCVEPRTYTVRPHYDLDRPSSPPVSGEWFDREPRHRRSPSPPRWSNRRERSPSPPSKRRRYPEFDSDRDALGFTDEKNGRYRDNRGGYEPELSRGRIYP